jgi:hypothetical protein
VHEGDLTQRAYHPASRGEQVLAELDRYGDALETSVRDEVIEVIAVGETVTFQDVRPDRSVLPRRRDPPRLAACQGQPFPAPRQGVVQICGQASDLLIRLARTVLPG